MKIKHLFTVRMETEDALIANDNGAQEENEFSNDIPADFEK